MTDEFRKPPRASTDRDVLVRKERTPAGGVPTKPWHEEPTGVHTDQQVFRAVKALGEELQESKRQAAAAHGALKQEVIGFQKVVDERLTKQDLVLAKVSGQIDVLVPITRMRPSSSETKAVEAEKTQRVRITTNGKILMYIVGAAIAAAGIVLKAVLS